MVALILYPNYASYGIHIPFCYFSFLNVYHVSWPHCLRALLPQILVGLLLSYHWWNQLQIVWGPVLGSQFCVLLIMGHGQPALSLRLYALLNYIAAVFVLSQCAENETSLWQLWGSFPSRQRLSPWDGEREMERGKLYLPFYCFKYRQLLAHFTYLPCNPHWGLKFSPKSETSMAEPFFS